MMIKNFNADIANKFLEPFKALQFVTAYRSIGSHIFIEYGVPEYLVRRNGTKLLKGQLSFAIHSSNWKMVTPDGVIDTSDEVDDHSLAYMVTTCFQHNGQPFVSTAEENKVILNFSRNIKLIIGKCHLDRIHKEDADLLISYKNNMFLGFNSEMGFLPKAK